MISISQLTKEEAKALFDKIIMFRQKKFSMEDIAFQCNTSLWTVQRTLERAKKANVELPKITQGGNGNFRHPYQKEPKKEIVLSDMRLRVMAEDIKHIEVKQVTQHFHFTKDFNYLF
jgi:predicted transcriptional regulator